jgi:hypothetical protein
MISVCWEPRPGGPDEHRDHGTSPGVAWSASAGSASVLRITWEPFADRPRLRGVGAAVVVDSDKAGRLWAEVGRDRGEVQIGG